MKKTEKQSTSSSRPRASRMTQESQDAYKERRERLYSGETEESQRPPVRGSDETRPPRSRAAEGGQAAQPVRRIPIQMTEHMVELAEAISERTQMEFGELLSLLMKNALSVYATKLNIKVKKQKYIAEFQTKEREVRPGRRDQGDAAGGEQGYGDRGRSGGRGRFGGGEGGKFRSREGGEGGKFRSREGGEGREFGGGEGRKFRDREGGFAGGEGGAARPRGKFGGGGKPGGRGGKPEGGYGRKPGKPGGGYGGRRPQGGSTRRPSGGSQGRGK